MQGKVITGGFKVAAGPDKDTAASSFIFEEAKNEKHSRKLFIEYVRSTYPFQPDHLSKICYIIPLSEIY